MQSEAVRLCFNAGPSSRAAVHFAGIQYTPHINTTVLSQFSPQLTHPPTPRLQVKETKAEVSGQGCTERQAAARREEEAEEGEDRGGWGRTDCCRVECQGLFVCHFYGW